MDMAVTIMIKNVMALEVSRLTNAHRSAQGDVARPSTTNHACSSVRNAAGLACVCHQGIMGTNKFALVTTTGRPRKEAPNALKLLHQVYFIITLIFMIKHKFVAL
ncbi:putative transcription factor [Hibiscus syriacus]|uniref:Transcription factor n=1 Tax=Hibiscus syriacus TaxID=106335 RepID=A0A6A2ZRF0_HIBSY|nr:putative transcription factor [Hibiscus syriacus]